MKLKKISAESLDAIAKLLKSLADPTRLQIMQCLQRGEMCVGDIVIALNAGQANISKHLQVLSQANLVKSERRGTQIYYSLFDDCINSICDAVCTGYEKIIQKKIKGLVKQAS